MPKKKQEGLSLWEAQQHFCRDKWLTYEQVGDWETLGAVWEDLQQKLISGELQATGFCESIKSEPIPADAWNVLGPSKLVDLKASIVDGPGTRVEGIRVFATAKFTTATRARFRKWFRAQVDSGKRPSTKNAMFQEAIALFPGLPKSHFRAVWQELAPSDWTRPGRKSSS